jgi:hypothetical protein
MEATVGLLAVSLAVGWFLPATWAWFGRAMGAYGAGSALGLWLAWSVDEASGQTADLEILAVTLFLYPVGLLVAALGAGWASLARHEVLPRTTSRWRLAALALPALPLAAAGAWALLGPEGPLSAVVGTALLGAGAGFVAKRIGDWTVALAWVRRPSAAWTAYAAGMYPLAAALTTLILVLVADVPERVPAATGAYLLAVPLFVAGVLLARTQARPQARAP